MGRHLTKVAGRMETGWPVYLVGLTALVAAGAALLVPAEIVEVTEIATVLAFGALATLAGHRWGLLVVAPAEILAVGKLWPVALLHPPATTFAAVAAGVAILSALPGFVLAARTLPRTAELFFGAGSRLGSHAVRVTAASLALWLVSPMIF